MPAAESVEELLKVKLLAAIGDVNNFLRTPGLEPVINRREIGRRVIKSAITLLNQLWIRLPFTIAIDQERIFLGWQFAIAEHALRAFAFARYALGHEVVDDSLEARVVKTFAVDVVELNPKPAVNFIE